jgi:hypothetical protein
MGSLRVNRTATVAGYARAIRWVPLTWVVLMLWANAAVAQEGEANGPQPSNARRAPGERLRAALAEDPEACFRDMSNGQERVGKGDFQRHLLAKFEQLKDRPALAGRMFDRLDADRDGFLTLNEFRAIKHRGPAAKPPAGRTEEPPPVDVAAESASHREVEPLAVSFKSLSALRVDQQGHLLACDEEAHEIKVVDPTGKQIAVIDPGVAPEALAVAADGTIYCGGQGQVVKLDGSGKVLATAKIPEDAGPQVSEPRRATETRLRLSGIAASDQDVFIAFGIGWHLSAKAKLFRFDRDLGQPRMLAEGLRGCCQRCDIVTGGGVVYLAENAAHRVVLYDREGEVLGKWGQRSRHELEGFGSCCNPMNLWLAGDVIYTAESGLGRVKRYTTDGKLLGLVGYVGVDRFQNASQLAASCSNMALAVTHGGDRVYLVDVKHNRIRVLVKKD